MRIGTTLLAGALALGTAIGGGAGSAEEPRGAHDVWGHDVWGLWYTPDRDSLVRIADCGDGTPCGTVAWIDPVRGEVTHDDHNPDEALRGRPMEGVTLLSGFEASERGWRGGAIYHPGQGKTYRARVRRTGAHALKVSGCVGPVCKGMTWHRADEATDDRLASSR